MKIINITDWKDKLFDEFYKGSALTLEGLDLDSLSDYNDYLTPFKNVEDITFYIIKGEVFNERFPSTYGDDIHIVVVKLDELRDIGRLSLARFEFGGRWFDDVVDNILRRW
jgi:hypothetical protein